MFLTKRSGITKLKKEINTEKKMQLLKTFIYKLRNTKHMIPGIVLIKTVNLTIEPEISCQKMMFCAKLMYEYIF